MRKIFLLCMIVILVLVGCGAPSSTNEEVLQEEVREEAYKLGDEVVFSVGDAEVYSLTFNSVTAIEERNQFAEENPVQVVVVDFTYKNLSGEKELYVTDTNFKIIDEGGAIASVYPANISKYPQTLPAGMTNTSCTAQMAVGLENESSKITVLFYEGILSNEPDATFELDIE